MKPKRKLARQRLRQATKSEFEKLIGGANVTPTQEKILRLHFVKDWSVCQIAMSLSCCCDNRAGLADLKYTVATENCADRQAISDGLRDVIANNTANTNSLAQAINQGIQSIKDDLCQDRLDAERRENEQLRTQLNMANLAASQTAQTARLIQDNNAQTAALIQRIAPAPVPSWNVPPPFGYFGNQGCCGFNG